MAVCDLSNFYWIHLNCHATSKSHERLERVYRGRTWQSIVMCLCVCGFSTESCGGGREEFSLRWCVFVLRDRSSPLPDTVTLSVTWRNREEGEREGVKERKREKVAAVDVGNMPWSGVVNFFFVTHKGAILTSSVMLEEWLCMALQLCLQYICEFFIFILLYAITAPFFLWIPSILLISKSSYNIFRPCHGSSTQCFCFAFFHFFLLQMIWVSTTLFILFIRYYGWACF